tara:strand:+ start:45 stop:2348 length:2304 start_codon:yes stop_codon:yes gene_type:complete
MYKKVHILICFVIFTLQVFSTEYYVSKKGNDNNSGNKKAPFLTIQKAASIMVAGDVCYIEQGVYTENIILKNSGTEALPIVFKALRKNSKVIITGTNSIPKSSWTKVAEHIFKTKIQLNLKEENQLFLGDKMMVEARWPNIGDDLLKPEMAFMTEGTTPNTIVSEKLPDYDFTGGYVWVHAKYYWQNWTTEIESNTPNSLAIKDRAPYLGESKHMAQPGAGFYVFGIKDALDTDNEWFYNKKTKELFVYRSDNEIPTENYFYKSRVNAFDFSRAKYVTIQDITILGASIKTSINTSNLILDRVKVLYPYYRSQNNKMYPKLNTKGFVLNGKNSIVKNSELAYSSGACIVLNGQNNKLLNSYIHDGNLIGDIMGNVVLEGKGNVISHCTITRSGRTLIRYSQMYQALIQNCELSYSGLLSSDLGLTYGTNIEGGNSEVRYNLMHDNLSEDKEKSMGLYYDHGTKNIISHHNIIWGVDQAGLLINHYAANHLVYNNTFISKKYGFKSSWGQEYGPDLLHSRFANNAFNAPSGTTAENYYWNNNSTDFHDFNEKNPWIGYQKGFGKGVFIEGISANSKKPGIGAIEYKGMTFKAGHDFENPPKKYNFTRSKPAYRNLLQNAAFEHEDYFHPWQAKEKVKGEGVKPVKHQTQYHGKKDINEGRMGNHSVQMITAGSEMFQKVSELQSGRTYEFIAHVRVSWGEQIVLGVRFSDGEEQLSPIVDKGSPNWRKLILNFTQPQNTTTAEVFVRRLTRNGKWKKVYIDDLSLNLK